MAQNNGWGGRFVVEDMAPEDIVTPEDFTDEQVMIGAAARAFLEGEIRPRDAEIEALDYKLTVELMRKAGELGLLGADVPEAYGGLGLDKVSSTLLAETLAEASSFALSVGAHVGIGTLPIVFFGTPEQKAKYLPDLAAGTKIAAYCLTEPSSGSDALGAKTKARLNAEGTHYVLNGSKLYITNSGFADVFIVYAKVNGDHFTAFIVERGLPGFSIGPEEHKMGIKGSSTCPIFFDDTPVPVENVLGEVGKGHLIAFNILNIGRFKLAAACVGGAKETVGLAAKYANGRKQFGRPIASFPLIGAKLADMNIAAFVTESMVYRTAGWIDETLKNAEAEGGGAASEAGARAAKAISEYALECSINKVFATEALDYAADEAVQIHGGYGYIKEYKVERIYRDSRINRIFEGTNEINRMLIPGTLMKKALKGELPLLRKARALQAELLQPMPLPSFDEPLSKETYRIAQAKRTFLAVGGLAVQKYGLALEQQQEVLVLLADMMIQTFAMESASLRTRKMLRKAGADPAAATRARNAVEMTVVFVQEAMERVERYAKTALAAVETGDALQTQLAVLKKLMRAPLDDTIMLKRSIAARVIRSQQYTL
ncbi:acyl-CoA dehydrogenase family protein [Paenibacillus sacheonensis]|uniref:Acyl-CoA dehydrogenase n=1 Tax=Paenibacillus sacheonensis TaxID=742054 RepID=A0A7X4YWF4_9BACL|nr:acyl-CoA dehydrogenase family protein [Paenibacillus sacheonensis]MBM7568936.1 alkylation response protein AidB-like acyl-CoA dehydrogenase [Paenibacillus sacheonensis]NBC72689.1 acyl-CoA dehydrogenase [Paenibacillus sacheonensis]